MFPHFKPGDTLEIFGDIWRVEPNLFKKDSPLVLEGRKASICKIRNNQGSFSALKLFRKKFQEPVMEQICEKIQQFSIIPGMEACGRRVITPANNPHILAKYPDFLYSVLMPWISGESWCEVLFRSQKKKTPLVSKEQSLTLAGKLAQTLKELEDHQSAHTDISSGNVIVDLSANRISLIDVEDIYAPTFRSPSVITAGTKGYQHRESSAGLWREDADRFAGAVLIIEILAVSKTDTIPHISGESFFEPDEMHNLWSARYIKITEMLKKYHSSVVSLWERVWSSASLAQCPKFSEWLTAIQEQTKTVCDNPFDPVIGWAGAIKIPSQSARPASQEIKVKWKHIIPPHTPSPIPFIRQNPTKIKAASVTPPHDTSIEDTLKAVSSALAKYRKSLESTYQGFGEPITPPPQFRGYIFPLREDTRQCHISFPKLSWLVPETAIEKFGLIAGSFIGLIIGSILDHKLNISFFAPLGIISGCLFGVWLGHLLDDL